MNTILDCYTDEPAGLGVPPYLGTYPRYLFGKLKDAYYITIDDLRNLKEGKQKTNIKIYNKTNKDVNKILQNTKNLYIIAGIHTPGKYLSAKPGTIPEIIALTKELKCKKFLVGPAAYGTALEGGKFAQFSKSFDAVDPLDFSYEEIKNYAVKGASLVKEIPDLRIIEIETAHGCTRKLGCSFCLEPIKHKFEFRKAEDILNEIKTLYDFGCRYFRLGKQSCIYSYPELETLLSDIKENCPDIKTLHIDNANPIMVDEEKTKLIVKYCTPGNIAAFGVESFDENVIKANNLNAAPEQVIKAIKIINQYGKERGYNGLPKFLPGINLILGLKDETKETLEINYDYLKTILDSDLLLRRINIRQVSVFPGTEMEKIGLKFLKKNKKYYYNFINKIRKEIDLPMLKKIVPKGTVLKDVRTEIHDGNTTFCRQLASYPLIIGIKQRLPLKKFINVRVTDWGLRSVTGELVCYT